MFFAVEPTVGGSGEAVFRFALSVDFAVGCCMKENIKCYS